MHRALIEICHRALNRLKEEIVVYAQREANDKRVERWDNWKTLMLWQLFMCVCFFFIFMSIFNDSRNDYHIREKNDRTIFKKEEENVLLVSRRYWRKWLHNMQKKKNYSSISLNRKVKVEWSAH